MDTRIKLRVQGLTNSQIQSGAYALILAEEDGVRRIPIIVGTSEAQSIAIALERIMPPRPLTHDLFATFAQAFGVRLCEVFIYKFEDGVFYSELLFEDGIKQIRLDSRTSDAIAIALRVKCDIYTTPENGIVDINSQLNDETKLKKWLSLLDVDELSDRLDEAIADENYEYAKMYKDEIRRREEEGRSR